MIGAPQPILGLEADPALAMRKQQLQVAARRALWLAAASVLLTIVLVSSWVTRLIQAYYFPRQRPLGREDYLLFGALGVVCVVLLLTSLGCGVHTRQTIAGKAAMIVALLPFGVALVLAILPPR